VKEILCLIHYNKKYAWILCYVVVFLPLTGCDDPFANDPIDDLSYPSLNPIKVPEGRGQPHSVFDTSKATEASIDAARQQEIVLHKHLWDTAKEQEATQAPIENSIP
jgi:hypothetical protein